MKQNSSTPEGFRNLRVLIPEDLHWRLRDLAHQSRMPFHQYILTRLSEATSPSPPTDQDDQRTSPDPPQTGESGLSPLSGHATPKPPDVGDESTNQESPPPGPGRQATPITPPNPTEQTTR